MLLIAAVVAGLVAAFLIIASGLTPDRTATGIISAMVGLIIVGVI